MFLKPFFHIYNDNLVRLSFSNLLTSNFLKIISFHIFHNEMFTKMASRVNIRGKVSFVELVGYDELFVPEIM